MLLRSSSSLTETSRVGGWAEELRFLVLASVVVGTVVLELLRTGPAVLAEEVVSSAERRLLPDGRGDAAAAEVLSSGTSSVGGGAVAFRFGGAAEARALEDATEASRREEWNLSSEESEVRSSDA